MRWREALWRKVVSIKYDSTIRRLGALWRGRVEMYKEGMGRFC